jgi:hypothetical protein
MMNVLFGNVMDNLQLFKYHINNLQMAINFTKYLEYNSSVSFLFAFVIRRVSFVEQQWVES